MLSHVPIGTHTTRVRWCIVICIVCHMHCVHTCCSSAVVSTVATENRIHALVSRFLGCSYKEDIGVVSATIDAAMEADLPPGVQRTLYLCDDGKVRRATSALTPCAGRVLACCAVRCTAAIALSASRAYTRGLHIAKCLGASGHKPSINVSLHGRAQDANKRAWLEEKWGSTGSVVYVSGRTRAKGEVSAGPAGSRCRKCCRPSAISTCSLQTPLASTPPTPPDQREERQPQQLPQERDLPRAGQPARRHPQGGDAGGV